MMGGKTGQLSLGIDFSDSFHSPKPAVGKFDGATYDKSKDGQRLTTLMSRVYELMRDGRWRTLSTIAKKCKGTEASVSARLRDLRKDKFQMRYPSKRVDRKRIDNGNGLHTYRVVVGVVL